MKRLLVGTILGCAMLGGSWQGVHAAGRIPAPGHVIFGWGINRHTLGVIHPLTAVRSGRRIWMSAHFSQAPGMAVTFTIARELGGGTLRLVAEQHVQMSDPRYNGFADRYDPAFAPGWYQIEFVRGSSVIAQGTLHITR